MDRSDIPFLFRAIAALALVLLLAPTIVTVIAAFNAGNYLQFPPQGFSLRWIQEFLTGPLFLENFTFSFRLAFFATILSTLLGTAAAVGMSRLRFRGRETLRAVLLAPIVLPGMVLGLALLSFYATIQMGLFRTFPGLLLAHVLVTLPFVFATVAAALARFDQSLEDAARSLGAGPVRAFVDVTMRVISQGILAGATFAFIVSFGQFDISLFLATSEMRPLPIALYDSIRYRTDPSIAAAGVFAISTVFLSMTLVHVLTNKGKRAAPKG